jgi:NAD-dependent SIR2 family protein deacetylase
MSDFDDLPTLRCATCERSVRPEDATRTRTCGDLDPERWQTPCCPDCGRRLKTVFLGP